jgi:tetratricopeptide (TPR) repeat protein
MMIAEGKTEDAVDALLKYLDTFSLDTEAWEFLVTLYQNNKKLDQAVFCLEELLLLRPQNAEYMLRYAEVCDNHGSMIFVFFSTFLFYYSTVS